jgi:hypothetical protein
MIMTLTEKTAYIQGLADGLDLDKTSKEGKLIAALIDLTSEMAKTIAEQQEQLDTLHDYIEEIDEDLGEVEEFIMDEFGDEDDFDCDCDCCCDDEDDDDEYYEITCPSCGEVICFDETVDPADLVCPACHEHFDCICDGCCDCDEEEEEEDKD